MTVKLGALRALRGTRRVEPPPRPKGKAVPAASSDGRADLVELLTIYGRLGSGSYALAYALTGDRTRAEQVLIDAFSIADGTRFGMNTAIEQEVLAESIVLACQRLDLAATQARNLANSPKPVRPPQSEPPRPALKVVRRESSEQ